MNNINKDTQICISLSSNPGNLGTKLHNAAYKRLGLNFIYKACKTQNIKDAIIGVRALNFRGCSVSMPFKSEVINLVDKLDKSAKSTNAVNTIVNKNGMLVGFNTDTTATVELIKNTNVDRKDKILIIGAGGVAKAIIFALKSLGFKNIYVANRTFRNIKKLNKICKINAVKFSDISKIDCSVLINATSLGMKNSKEQRYIENIENKVKYLKLIFDVVIANNDTYLIKLAKQHKIQHITGNQLGRTQAMHQFRLYTSKKPPKEIFLPENKKN